MLTQSSKQSLRNFLRSRRDKAKRGRSSERILDKLGTAGQKSAADAPDTFILSFLYFVHANKFPIRGAVIAKKISVIATANGTQNTATKANLSQTILGISGVVVSLFFRNQVGIKEKIPPATKNTKADTNTRLSPPSTDRLNTINPPSNEDESAPSTMRTR